MRHFIVVEENADRLYKKTYFFNEILKIQFFPTNCFSNTAKAVDIKIISPMNFCSDRSLHSSKNNSRGVVRRNLNSRFFSVLPKGATSYGPWDVPQDS